MVSLLVQPSTLFSPSFQLSYLSCFALLLFYPRIRKTLAIYLNASTRPYKRNNILLCWSSYLQQALSATLSIYFLTFPVVIAHFSAFAYSGMLYNLFFPGIIGILMGLWALFWPLTFFSSYGKGLVSITDSALNICLYAPVCCQTCVCAQSISSEGAFFWVALLLFAGFALQGDPSFRYHIE